LRCAIDEETITCVYGDTKNTSTTSNSAAAVIHGVNEDSTEAKTAAVEGDSPSVNRRQFDSAGITSEQDLSSTAMDSSAVVRAILEAVRAMNISRGTLHEAARQLLSDPSIALRDGTCANDGGTIDGERPAVRARRDKLRRELMVPTDSPRAARCDSIPPQSCVNTEALYGSINGSEIKKNKTNDEITEDESRQQSAYNKNKASTNDSDSLPFGNKRASPQLPDSTPVGEESDEIKGNVTGRSEEEARRDLSTPHYVWRGHRYERAMGSTATVCTVPGWIQVQHINTVECLPTI
jgi:hypothetical protein